MQFSRFVKELFSFFDWFYQVTQFVISGLKIEMW